MPYFTDYLKKEDEENPSQVQISGASPTTDSSGALSQQKGDNKGLVTGSGYQNLDKYLTTNQPQAFGQQVLGKVGSEVGAVQQNIGKIEGAKSQIAEQNKTPEQAQLNAAIANPTGANAETWQAWQNQKYQGPQSTADVGAYNQLGSATQKAQTSAKLLGNEAGRFTLLDSYFGRPNYNFGEKSLDNLMLQNAGVGRQAQGLQNQVTALKTEGQEVGKGLQNTITGTQGQVAASRAATRGAIGIGENGEVLTGDKAGAIGQQWSAVDQALASQNAARQAENASISSGLSNGILSPEQMAKFGLTAGEQTYNINPGSYFTAGADLTKNQVMTPEQQARIRALSSMAGITDTYATGDLSAKSDPYSFNTAQFKNDVGGAKSAYERESDALFKQVADQDVRDDGGDPNVADDPYQYANYLRGVVGGNDYNGFASSDVNTQNALKKYNAAKAALDSKYGVGNSIGPTGRTMGGIRR
jgi:hypothetical protein